MNSAWLQKAGQTMIRGTKIPVELLVRLVAQGTSQEDILKEYPRLEAEDIKAALANAASILIQEEPHAGQRNRN